MADPTQETRAKIPLKRFLADYKSGVPDREIMQKYGLSARSLISLIKTLMEKSVLSPEDLARRKQMTEQVELVKEQQFLKGLFICPNCGHPHPQQFDVCPACEAKLADYSVPQQAVEDVTTTGGHFYVDDTTTVVDEPEEPQEDKTEPIHSEEPKDETPTEEITPPKTKPETKPPADTQPMTPDSEQASPTPQESAPVIKPKPEDSVRDKAQDESKDKASPFKSVRALISKIRKT